MSGGGVAPPNTPSFPHLHSAVVALILAASGMVHLHHIAFVLLSPFYLLFLSTFSFPALSTTPQPPVFSAHQRLLTIYVSVGALIGLLLPVAYILHCQLLVTGHDKEGVVLKAAAAHLFLLASQVLMEGVTFYCGVSLPIRVFVPVSYNAMRMYVIWDWVKSEVLLLKGGGGGGGGYYVNVGVGLAVANLVFWGFNLFGFLLPVYLPRAFKKYYAADVDKVKDS